jgi:hypothetical protein
MIYFFDFVPSSRGSKSFGSGLADILNLPPPVSETDSENIKTVRHGIKFNVIESVLEFLFCWIFYLGDESTYTYTGVLKSTSG